MSTRDKILDAAARVITELGLAHATTKQIAKAAGYSEATLYKHFDDKTALFLAVLTERSQQDLAGELRALHERTDEDIRGALRSTAETAIGFYRQGFPMAGALFAEPQLLRSHREALASREASPRHVIASLSRYLRRGQQTGLLNPHADPEATAQLLLGACFQQAFFSHFDTNANDDSQLAETLVDALWDGLRPFDH